MKQLTNKIFYLLVDVLIGHNLALKLKNLTFNMIIDSLSVINFTTFTDKDIINKKLYNNSK